MMHADIRVKLLGPVEIETELGSESLPSARMRSLLAVLALANGRTISTPTLINELWGEQQIKNAKNACHATISRLRRLVEFDGIEVVQTRPSGYRLCPECVQTDVDHFGTAERNARDLASADPHAAVAVIDDALALFRGPALEDVDRCSLLDAQRVAIEERHLSLLELRSSCLLELGQCAAATSSLQQLTRSHPDRERLHAQLMIALYREGRQAEALGTYRRVMEYLRDEYGLDPSAQLQRLHGAILQRLPAEVLAH